MAAHATTVARITPALAGSAIAAFAVYAALLSPYGAYLFFFPLAFAVALWLRPATFLETFLLVGAALLLRFWGAHLMPDIIIFDDEKGYARMGTGVHDYLWGARGEWHINHWVNVAGILFYAFGKSLIVIKALNSFLGVATAFLAHNVSLRIYKDERVARVTLYLTLFLPPFLLISSIALKEQAISTLLVAVVGGAARGGRSGWAGCLVSCFLLTLLRSSLGVVVGGLLGLYALSGIFGSVKISVGIKRLLLGFAAFLLLAGGAVAFKWGMSNGLKIALILSGEDRRGASALRNNRAQFVGYLDTQNPFAPRNLVLSPIRSIFSPSPLASIKSPSRKNHMETFGMTLYLYLAFPFVALGILASGKSPLRWLVVFSWFTVFGLASLSILTFAPETFRYRWPDFPLYFMLAAVGWHLGSERWRKPACWGWSIAVAAFAAAYLR